jgi:hypothetical protein
MSPISIERPHWGHAFKRSTKSLACQGVQGDIYPCCRMYPNGRFDMAPFLHSVTFAACDPNIILRHDPARSYKRVPYQIGRSVMKSRLPISIERPHWGHAFKRSTNNIILRHDPARSYKLFQGSDGALATWCLPTNVSVHAIFNWEYLNVVNGDVGRKTPSCQSSIAPLKEFILFHGHSRHVNSKRMRYICSAVVLVVSVGVQRGGGRVSTRSSPSMVKTSLPLCLPDWS